jgi:hypothetical protein
MGKSSATSYIEIMSTETGKNDEVEVHNTGEVLFRLCANTDPQRDSILRKGPASALDCPHSINVTLSK